MNTIDLGELHQGLKVRLPFALAIGPKPFNAEVQPDLIPVLKAVGDGLLGRIDAHRDAIDLDDIDTSTERCFGIPEDA